jgi:hypothetical protein
MDPKFAQLVDRLHPAFLKLVSRPAVADGAMPNYAQEGTIATKGVYLFTEAGTHLYVGRSNRLSERCVNELKLAFELTAPEARIRKANYKHLSYKEAWDGAMAQAKARIAAMEYRWVEEADPTCQCLLQLYASVALATKYNDFDIH